MRVSAEDDVLARGQYPIALAPSNTLVTEAIRNGLPLAEHDGSLMTEGTYLSAGNSTVSVFRNAPNPNATKVYLDWLLSREGQTLWSQMQEYPSNRLDVPTEHVNPIYIPRPGMQYHLGYGERYAELNQAAIQFVNTLGVP